MKILTVNNEFEIKDSIINLMQNGGGLVKAAFTLDHSVIGTGASPLINDDIRQENNIGVYHLAHLFGPIIHFSGDLCFMLVNYGPTNFGQKCIETIANYLEEKNIPIEIQGNDLMAENRKVGSWATSNDASGWYQIVVHFSINTDIDMVKEICMKEMIKEPGALKDYGITAEMLWDELIAKNVIEVNDNA